MLALRAPLGALLLALALLAAPGCDASGDAQTIGGTYVGSATVSGLGTVTFRVAIPQVSSGATFRYSGTARFQSEPAESFSGRGAYDHPDLEMTDDEDPSDVVRGTVSADGDRITLIDAESDLTVVLTR